jgi:hypothetical protein
MFGRIMQRNVLYKWLTIYALVFYCKKSNNFMQPIPKKEIGELFENGHL